MYTIGKGYKTIHFHDPELIFAVLLRLAGITYDVQKIIVTIRDKKLWPIFLNH